jgi:CPA1 family monovalent cation:H+ antiporter
MALLDVVAILITLAAAFSYVNTQWLKLPMTIGLMLIALGLSLALMLAEQQGLNVRPFVRALLTRVDFSEALLQGMLSFLLFAGALHIDLQDLKRHSLVIGLLATVGLLASAALVGVGSYWSFGVLGVSVPFLSCLLFGALISPTDPIAVLAILKSANVPRDLSTKIAGESLFNDGTAVVLFIVLFQLASGSADLGVVDVVVLLLREVVGGVTLGFILGLVTYRLLKSVDDYQVEILLTLALVAGLFAVARRLHVSGPIGVVVAGLFIGNHGRSFAMSERTRENIDKFWELVDEILNAVLFVLIGLEVFLVQFSWPLFQASVVAIFITLFARFVSVGLPLTVLRRYRTLSPGTVRVLTWGGLRGGISVALALTLPHGAVRDSLVTITYHVVVASILLQGLTIKYLVRGVVARA